MPHSWNLVVLKTLSNTFKLNRHDNLSLNSLSKINERSSHNLDESVESEQLLLQHSVERLLVLNWMLSGSVLSVEWQWQLVNNVSGSFLDDLVLTHSLSTDFSWQERKSSVKHHGGLVNGRGNVGVVVETEDFSYIIDWEGFLDELWVAGQLSIGWNIVNSTFNKLVSFLEHVFVVEIS